MSELVATRAKSSVLPSGITPRTESRPLSKEVARRIAECKGTIRSNCRGTALYLVGKQESDSRVDIHEVKEIYLSKMKRSPTPAQGCLVAWESDGLVHHMGVVTSVNHPSVLIAHRDGELGPFIQDVPLSKIDLELNQLYMEYGMGDEMHKRVFYLTGP